MRTALSLLSFGTLLACADSTTSPAAAGGVDEPSAGVSAMMLPCNKPTITATPSSATRLRNTGPYNVTFTLKNNCTTTLFAQALTSSRSGSVTSVSTPTPSGISAMAPGTSKSTVVSYNVGAVGTGTVVLKATNDVDPTLVATKTHSVTVN